MLDFSRITHLTFDCYGTLIDWETGILNEMVPMLARYTVTASEETILQLYTEYEAEEERRPYRPYREILTTVSARMAEHFAVEPTGSDRTALADSVGKWPAFPDTVDALQRLKAHFKLVILSNIDDDLFAQTARHLYVEFDDVITAQQVRSYKPGKAHFEIALERLGAPRESVLHVAQSLYHDHVPAKEMGFSTVWIDRPSRLPHTGLSLPAAVQPDLTFTDLVSLADTVEQQADALDHSVDGRAT
jgi:2-haloacid dehalogenase